MLYLTQRAKQDVWYAMGHRPLLERRHLFMRRVSSNMDYGCRSSQWTAMQPSRQAVGSCLLTGILPPHVLERRACTHVALLAVSGPTPTCPCSSAANPPGLGVAGSSRGRPVVLVTDTVAEQSRALLKAFKACVSSSVRDRKQAFAASPITRAPGVKNGEPWCYVWCALEGRGTS